MRRAPLVQVSTTPRRSRGRAVLLACALALCSGAPARAASRTAWPAPDGAALVKLLGPRATRTLSSPQSPGIGALVRLPAGAKAGDMGLREASPGIARLWDTPAGLVAFADAHPELPIEIAPPMRLVLDRAAAFVRVPRATSAPFQSLVPDGTGVAIGIADTGVDLTHPDFLDPGGKTRVAWLLDLGAPPRGKWPALETQYGLTDPSTGGVAWGAVWSADEINAAMASGQASILPQDFIGHGTLVTSCAAGNGAAGTSIYEGIAPGATIVLARILDQSGNLRGNDEVLGAVKFLFDRADFLQLPIVVNLSIGTDFGPHDGTTAWEQVLASHVGPGLPGHVLVAAAGNSGAIDLAEAPVHNNVFVPPGTTLRVPIVTSGAQNGGVEVWVAMHKGANLRVGLDGPGGTWISPVGDGGSVGCCGTGAQSGCGDCPGGGANGPPANGYQAGVINGSEPKGSPVPPQSHGAIVIWTGTWSPGTYFVTLQGSGNADLYMQGDGDAFTPGAGNFGFLHGVREATISLPATHPNILAVGCTINKIGWRSINGSSFGPQVPILDFVGGMPDPHGAEREPIEGEPCWFSGAGPTLTGIQKPEIMAPGQAIVGALSSQAVPPAPMSIFTTPCPNKSGNRPDQDCSQVDATHAAAGGTSFSAPIAAGAVAVLLQQNPNLTQGDVLALLQGGAHRLRGRAPFEDQAGVGEVDVLGALAAAAASQSSDVVLPSRTQSWLSVGAEYCLADGSTPLQAVLELRGEALGSAPPPAATGFGDSRLAAYAQVTGPGGDVSPTASLVRRGAGVWLVTAIVPPGLGGSTLTLGARFDDFDVVEPKTLPIATDHWNADYAPRVAGGCSVQGASGGKEHPSGSILVLAGIVFLGVLSRVRFRATPRQSRGRGRSARAGNSLGHVKLSEQIRGPSVTNFTGS